MYVACLERLSARDITKLFVRVKVTGLIVRPPGSGPHYIAGLLSLFDGVNGRKTANDRTEPHGTEQRGMDYRTVYCFQLYIFHHSNYVL